MRRIEEKEVQSLFSEPAKKGAKIICCGEDMCLNNHGCGQCPVAKYNIKPDDRLPEERESGDGIYDAKTINKCLFAVCACCEYATVIEDNGAYTLHHSDNDFRNYCASCPVMQCIESMQETETEAAMS